MLDQDLLDVAAWTRAPSVCWRGHFGLSQKPSLRDGDGSEGWNVLGTKQIIAQHAYPAHAHNVARLRKHKFSDAPGTHAQIEPEIGF